MKSHTHTEGEEEFWVKTAGRAKKKKKKKKSVSVLEPSGNASSFTVINNISHCVLSECIAVVT